MINGGVSRTNANIALDMLEAGELFKDKPVLSAATLDKIIARHELPMGHVDKDYVLDVQELNLWITNNGGRSVNPSSRRRKWF